MFTKVVVFITIFLGAAQAGNEAPPPKVHSYNVPSVAKVSYPGPTVTKSVETYSAPSIEKTTTITRTITAPLNAPAGKQVAYAAPSPVLKPAPAAVYAGPAALPAAPLYAAPAQYAYAGPAHYAQPAAIAAPAYAAGPSIGHVSAPGLALNSAPLGHGAFGNQFASLYAAPSLGYALQQPQFLAGPAYAAPAYAGGVGHGHIAAPVKGY